MRSLVVAVLTGLLVTATGACAQQDFPGHAAPMAPPLSPLDGEGPLTEADVAAVDRDRLVEEFLIALTTQPVLHVRMENIRDVPAFLAGQDNHGFVEGGYDFRSNEFAYLEAHGFEHLCTGGSEYSWDSLDQVWEEDAAFVRAMREDYPGFLQPGEPSLVEHGGAQYVRLPLVFKAVDVGGGKRYGMANLNWAFREIGPRYDTHVLSPGGGAAVIEQVEGVYYLDPGTRLPAYSEALIYDPAGDPAATTGKTIRTEYLWDGAVPRFEPSTTPPTPQPPSWPAERPSPREKP